jgi:serine/threonine protein phosphatase PrpC
MNHDTTAISLRTWGLSDIGRVRNNNEDSFLIVNLTTGASLTQGDTAPSPGFLLMVADGMGGHEAGEVASHMAVETVSQYVTTSLTGSPLPSRRRFVHILKEAVVQTNTAIYDASQADIKRQGMGTTLTAAGVYDGAAFFVQVSDSRACVIRTNTAMQMTQDQNLATELATACLENPNHQPEVPYQTVLLQALGAEPEVTVPVFVPRITARRLDCRLQRWVDYLGTGRRNRRRASACRRPTSGMSYPRGDRKRQGRTGQRHRRCPPVAMDHHFLFHM